MDLNDRNKFKNIFISTMTNSGSTLLQNFISTSENVIKHNNKNDEGICQLDDIKKYPKSLLKDGNIPRIFTNQCNKIRNVNNFDWDYIKKNWNDQWLKTISDNLINKYDLLYLLEKTPQNVIISDFIEKAFDYPYFVIMVRSPYETCEGIVRSVLKRHKCKLYINYKIAIIHWCECMDFQINNIKRLKNNIWFKYEDFCDNTENIKQRLEEFLPETEFKLNITYKSQKDNKTIVDYMKNMNEEQLSRLSKENINEINSILKNHKNIMDYFGYNYI